MQNDTRFFTEAVQEFRERVTPADDRIFADFSDEEVGRILRRAQELKEAQ